MTTTSRFNQCNTTTMNRAQRRAMMRNKQRLAERFVPLPALLDEFTIFDMPQTILDKLRNGEIEAYQGRPVFRDNTGAICEICPALSGWIYTWQRINDELGLNINLDPLGRLHNKLQADMPLQLADIEAAETTLTTMRQVFRASDRRQIASIAKTAQIAILIEESKTA